MHDHIEKLRRWGLAFVAPLLLHITQGCAESAYDPALASASDAPGGTALQAATEPTPGLLFGEVKVEGNGCLPDTFRIGYETPRDERVATKDFKYTKFIVAYDDYEVEARASDELVERYCVLKIPVEAPRGWQFAVTQFSFLGQVRLAEGMVASVTTTHYFAEDQVVGFALPQPFRGPMPPRTFEIMQAFNPAKDETVWSGCGEPRTFVASTRIQLYNPRKLDSGMLRVANTQGSASSGEVPDGVVRVRFGSEAPAFDGQDRGALRVSMALRPCAQPG